MLRSGAAENLVALLSNETDTLTDISTEFTDTFDFNDRICALTGCALLTLDGLLDHKQQFVAIWLLYSECQVDDICQHPYYSIFKTVFEGSNSTPNYFAPQVSILINCILNNINIDSISSEPIKNIYGRNFTFPQTSEIPATATNSKRNETAERVSPILISQNDSIDFDNVLTHSEVVIQLLQEEAFWLDYEAPFVRPIPEITPMSADELSVIKSFEAPPFLLDEGIIINTRAIALELLNKALEKKLRSPESDTLVNELKKDPSLVDDAKVSNSTLTSLIENNCEVAKYVIAILVPKKPTILKTLANLDVSASSVDVVKHLLTTIPDTPQDFTENYIANATKSILGIKDNPSMLRKARIFSKMIGFIVQNGYQLNSSSIFEMNSFCEEPKIRGLKEAQEINNILICSA
ncbi:hypothetical protein TRFO_09883 [Tritrichomonas foetus]|uniref:CCR4-NOT transcription complex subunit 11 n=1 Tax=Tritrichomonas foetus TaxID=1144522 RepID=A0A1J4JBI3_9EUKA|nr:hypothetical protein TRFO_09883 [Tritrichomonas foetus]|eukprot:OHS96504.1 hypothetical protein TRFO_09883 [Tritrichomonas foetus]